MRSKIPGCAEPKIQASQVLLRTKRKRNEPVGPDYILLDQKKTKSMDQNILSTKFSTLPLPIREEREGTQKRLIGETSTQHFVEVQRTRARAIPSTTTNNNTPSSAITPHHVGSSDRRFCVIDVVDMGLHNSISQSEVIPAVEDTTCGDEQQNWNRRQGDSILQDDAEKIEDGKEEWVYDIYRLSKTASSDKQQLLAQSSSSFGIVDLDEVGYAGGDEDNKLSKCNSELNFIMENDSEWSDLSGEDDKDSNDEDCYRNDYPDVEEGERDEDQHLVYAVDSETDEEWTSSDDEYTINGTYSPYGDTPAAQQAFWREVESDDDEDGL
eukprot:4947_1